MKGGGGGGHGRGPCGRAARAPTEEEAGGEDRKGVLGGPWTGVVPWELTEENGVFSGSVGGATARPDADAGGGGGVRGGPFRGGTPAPSGARQDAAPPEAGKVQAFAGGPRSVAAACKARACLEPAAVHGLGPDGAGPSLSGKNTAAGGSPALRQGGRKLENAPGNLATRQNVKNGLMFILACAKIPFERRGRFGSCFPVPLCVSLWSFVAKIPFAPPRLRVRFQRLFSG